MPVIQFTPADVLRSKILDTGWYGSLIKKVEAAASKNGDSVNYTVTFEIENMEGKEIERYFNSKAISMLLPLIAAVTGKQIKAENFQFDTDELVNKKVDCKVVTEIYEGRPVNKVTEFVPYGKGKELQPF